MGAFSTTHGDLILAESMALFAKEELTHKLGSLSKRVEGHFTETMKLPSIAYARATPKEVNAWIRKTREGTGNCDPFREASAALTLGAQARSLVEKASPTTGTWYPVGWNTANVIGKQLRALSLPWDENTSPKKPLIVGIGKKFHVKHALRALKWKNVTITDVLYTVSDPAYKGHSTDFLLTEAKEFADHDFIYSDAMLPLTQNVKKGAAPPQTLFSRTWPFARQCAATGVPIFVVKLMLPDTIAFEAHQDIYTQIFKNYEAVAVSPGARIQSGEHYVCFMKVDEQDPKHAFTRYIVGRVQQALWTKHANYAVNTWAAYGLAPPDHLFSKAVISSFDPQTPLPAYSCVSADPAKFVPQIEDIGFDDAFKNADVASVEGKGRTLARLVAQVYANEVAKNADDKDDPEDQGEGVVVDAPDTPDK